MENHPFTEEDTTMSSPINPEVNIVDIYPKACVELSPAQPEEYISRYTPFIATIAPSTSLKITFPEIWSVGLVSKLSPQDEKTNIEVIITSI